MSFSSAVTFPELSTYSFRNNLLRSLMKRNAIKYTGIQVQYTPDKAIIQGDENILLFRVMVVAYGWMIDKVHREKEITFSDQQQSLFESDIREIEKIFCLKRNRYPIINAYFNGQEIHWKHYSRSTGELYQEQSITEGGGGGTPLSSPPTSPLLPRKEKKDVDVEHINKVNLLDTNDFPILAKKTIMITTKDDKIAELEKALAESLSRLAFLEKEIGSTYSDQLFQSILSKIDKHVFLYEIKYYLKVLPQLEEDEFMEDFSPEIRELWREYLKYDKKGFVEMKEKFGLFLESEKK